MTRRPTHIAYTLRVEEALRARDDFTTERMLRAALPDVNANQISAALFSLRKCRSVDVIIDPSGEGFWYALPPELDLRRYRIVERATEFNPRRRRRTTKKEPK